MRVKLKQDVRLYWNYAVAVFEKGSEHIGDLAQHLYDNLHDAVEILEGEPEPPHTPPSDPVTPSTDNTGDAAPDLGDELAANDAGDEVPPVDGTIDVLMAWVDGDKGRAKAALAAEQAKDNPRSTVVKRLTALADADEQ